MLHRAHFVRPHQSRVPRYIRSKDCGEATVEAIGAPHLGRMVGDGLTV
jgi:hypothetical protein